MSEISLEFCEDVGVGEIWEAHQSFMLHLLKHQGDPFAEGPYIYLSSSSLSSFTPPIKNDQIHTYTPPHHITSIDSTRSRQFISHALPQILEDDIGERSEEQEIPTRNEESTEQSHVSHMDQVGTSSNPSRTEEGEVNTSECLDELSSGAVTPTSIDKEETEINVRSDTASLDSGCNMSQN